MLICINYNTYLPDVSIIFNYIFDIYDVVIFKYRYYKN